MADFHTALKRTLAFEGGFSNDTDDPGEMTFCGISRKAFPNIPLWKQIDIELTDGVTPSLENSGVLIQEYVSPVYREHFWNPIHGDEIESQEIANQLFDFAVNSGVRDAVKALQWALNKFFLPPNGEPNNWKLSIDGVLGKKTLSKLDDCFEFDGYGYVVEVIRCYRLNHLLNTIADNPKLAKFARGWARRVMA